MFVGAEEMDRIDVFRGINEFARKFLSEQMDIIHRPAGASILRKGETPANCYFILNGICHVLTPESRVGQGETGAQKVSIVERHQGFRGIGDNIGITSTLAHYAYQSQQSADLKKRKEIARYKYETFLEVGRNTATTHAITDCELLECSRDALLTAIQICPYLIANIARSISMRIQKDTLLQQRASLPSNDCLPLLAQFLYEWYMVTEAYKERGANIAAGIPRLHCEKIQTWLRIRDESALASALRLLQGDEESVQTLMEVKGLSREEASSHKCIKGVPHRLEVITPKALLDWCRETDSRRLITEEQKKRPKRPRRRRAGKQPLSDSGREEL